MDTYLLLKNNRILILEGENSRDETYTVREIGTFYGDNFIINQSEVTVSDTNLSVLQNVRWNI